MNITTIASAELDAITKKIEYLETQVALANSQLRAMQESNNHLAEIAFDESRFTQLVLDKVDDVARSSARDAIDLDELAEEAAQHVEIDDRIDDRLENFVRRQQLVTKDEVNDVVESWISDNNIPNQDDVQTIAEATITENFDFIERSEVDALLDEKINEIIEKIKEALCR